jgi:hypothetical protein
VRLRLAVIGLLWTSPLVAQRNDVRLDVAVPQGAAVSEGTTVTVANLLSAPKTRELLRSGFTTGIHFRLELWREGRVVNDLSDRLDWDVFVFYDPTAKLYYVVRRMGNVHENFGGFETITSAEAQFDAPFRVPLRATHSGRYYYNLVVDVQSLSESDLDASLQWLRGSSGPVKGNPITALRSGLGTFLSRALGGGKQEYQLKSGRFIVP